MSWVHEWVKDHGDDEQALDLLRSKLQNGDFGAGKAPQAEAFLKRIDDLRAHALSVRAVNAAEIQAEAAQQAVSRSNIAIVLSIAAVLLTVVDLLVRH